MTITIANLDDKLIVKGYHPDVESLAGAKFDRKNNMLTFPLEYRTYQLIKQVEPNAECTESVRSWVRRVQQARLNRERIKAVPYPDFSVSYVDKLFDYQKQGINFMCNVSKAIMGDDMGLGKTLQTITTVQELGCQKVLIVCPNSLKFTWSKEFKHWTGRECQVLTTSSKKRVLSGFKDGILVVNYESIWDRKTKDLLKEISKVNWDVVIYDEAHRLKNRKATHTKACKKIKAERTYMLTGTPIENSPDEMWSLLNIMYPKTFNSYWRFVEQWCKTSEFRVGGRQIKNVTGCLDPKAMHEMLSPIMIRRLKKDVLHQLPDKTYKTITVELNPSDRKVYDELRDEMVAELGTGEVVITANILTQMMRLRQVAISSQLLSEEEPMGLVKSSKLEVVEEIVSQSIDSHKLVLFTQFKSSLRIMKNLLESSGIKCLEISGDISSDKRQEYCDLFQSDDSYRVILCTIQTAGVGLTLTKADICIFIDKHYNPQLNKQAEDRLYRIGQKNSVQVISVIAKDTLEERIEDMLRTKNDMFEQVVNGRNLVSLI